MISVELAHRITTLSICIRTDPGSLRQHRGFVDGDSRLTSDCLYLTVNGD